MYFISKKITFIMKEKQNYQLSGMLSKDVNTKYLKSQYWIWL